MQYTPEYIERFRLATILVRHATHLFTTKEMAILTQLNPLTVESIREYTQTQDLQPLDPQSRSGGESEAGPVPPLT